MATQTKISWTNHTFNPWIGCRMVSTGCRHCYAERLVRERLRMDGLWNTDERYVTKTPWKDVRRWNRAAEREQLRHRVFVGSLCDVFDEAEPCSKLRDRLYETIRECRWLDFQLLTKRVHNIEKFLPSDWGDGWNNVWLGATVENQHNSWRADVLRTIPAAVRFISYEPALGPLKLDLTGIDWVIYGGETGPDYRQDDDEWARSMLRQCREQGVAFWYKQASASHMERRIELDGEVIRELPKPVASQSLMV